MGFVGLIGSQAYFIGDKLKKKYKLNFFLAYSAGIICVILEFVLLLGLIALCFINLGALLTTIAIVVIFSCVREYKKKKDDMFIITIFMFLQLPLTTSMMFNAFFNVNIFKFNWALSIFEKIIK
ncbi:hypothetical protein CLQ_13708 (plasmid) [Clostridium botulinum Af84]|uniref:hypothetical protein n=1 Tax=Clostridium botulinum TaxID=1491 RepID=UPI00035BB1A1|nr:hypothetical protein [Clostridium botulinum]APR02873.1 putative membrane protein [Clostridium botulinum]AUN19723.1 hypothetical protein B2M06_19390 [Clostridium botulinum]EPS54347.1 hypothetical protein CLQ_13708 [Clostridium botulinum Af84]NFM82279.1 hypothetical protein [Clostridium botulinum]NFP09970.1 hypothetical protein [Clostridium botulinum]